MWCISYKMSPVIGFICQQRGYADSIAWSQFLSNVRFYCALLWCWSSILGQHLFLLSNTPYIHMYVALWLETSFLSPWTLLATIISHFSGRVVCRLQVVMCWQLLAGWRGLTYCYTHTSETFLLLSTAAQAEDITVLCMHAQLWTCCQSHLRVETIIYLLSCSGCVCLNRLHNYASITPAREMGVRVCP